MQTRSAAAAAAFIGVAGIAGCTAQTPAPEERNGRITVEGTTHEAQGIDCTQINFLLTIDMDAGPSRAAAHLQLGAQPTVDTVSITNVDGFHGVAGYDVGDADVSVHDGTYTITGTAIGSDNPGETRTAPFEIEAPC